MPSSLSEWLSYIETLHPRTIAFGLERVRLVADKLQVLAFNCPVITVAGTNGKGSCVAFLEIIAQAAGYRVGTYTSPHLLRFNERIHLAGREATDDELVEAFTQVEQARGSVSLTYFEFTTIAALWLLQRADLQLLVLEVGLGGRLDAVNVVEPDVAIITSIDLDHMEWLGDTREDIGYEKAGIFRPNKPAICADINPPASITAVAQQVGATLYCAGRDFSVHDFLGASLPTRTQLPVPSAAAALVALDCLKQRLDIGHAAILHGLQTATLPGRFQRIRYRDREIILDVAHNPAASVLLAQQLAARPFDGLTHAVTSILADKDIEGILQPLLPQIASWFLSGLDLPRGTNAKNLANHLQNLGVAAYHIHTAESVAVALEAALQHCAATDRIVVFGSFYTVAAVLSHAHRTSRCEIGYQP